MSDTSDKINDKKSSVVQSTIAYEKGSILHSINADKYTGIITEAYIFEFIDVNIKYRIKKEVMETLADMDKSKNEYSYLFREGYEGSGKMSAGAGIAIKIEKTDTVYNCTFFEGEVGKPFDLKKIQSRTHMSVDKEHLNAIYTYLRFDKVVADAKAEARMLERSTLEL